MNISIVINVSLCIMKSIPKNFDEDFCDSKWVAEIDHRIESLMLLTDLAILKCYIWAQDDERERNRSKHSQIHSTPKKNVLLPLFDPM